MSDPVTWGLVISAVVGVGSAVQQGEAARKASNTNSDMMKRNAAASAEEAAANAAQQERATYLRLGAIRAAQGKSGGEAGVGSVLDIIGDTAIEGEKQKRFILRGGELKGAGYNSSAALDRAAGTNAQNAGYLKAGSTLLTSASGYYKDQSTADTSGINTYKD